jgi:hypothetical protein
MKVQFVESAHDVPEKSLEKPYRLNFDKNIVNMDDLHDALNLEKVPTMKNIHI